LLPRRDSWREGNVTEKGDGTCEGSVNFRLISANETSVAAGKQGEEVQGKVANDADTNPA